MINRLRFLNINAPNIAATTLFRQHHLPDEAVLGRYDKWDSQIKVFSSGHIDKVHDLERIGVIKTEVDILQKKEEAIEISLYGNAVQVNCTGT